MTRDWIRPIVFVHFLGLTARQAKNASSSVVQIEIFYRSNTLTSARLKSEVREFISQMNKQN